MTPTLAKRLTLNQLRAELTPLLGYKPSYRVLRRAMTNGMPYGSDLLTMRESFSLEEVLEWLKTGSLAPVPKPAASDAAARIVRRSPRPKPEKPVDDSPLVITFPCVGSGPPSYRVTEKMRDELAGAFPGVDLNSELKKALLWVNGNLQNRKTHGGMPKFLLGWMGRAQNSAPRKVDMSTSRSHPLRGEMDANFKSQINGRKVSDEDGSSKLF